jgi:Tol biopolymer transport system component
MIALSAESFQNAVLLDDLAVWSSAASAFIPRSFARQPAGAAVAFLQGGSGFANRVAYVERQRINSNNIYTFRFLEPDNRLRTLANQYYWPTFSPDGAFAAAVRNADYTGTLRLMRVYTPQEDNLFGGELELAYSANRFIQCPVWSPDGQFVAYLEAFTGQKTRLYVASAAGPNTAWGAPRLLDERSYLHCPEWSPLAGQHVLAYSASVDMLVNGLLYLNRDIFTVNVDTNARTQITNSLDDEWDIDWSPDGTKIAFHTFIDSDTELFYVSPIAAGGTVVRLTDNDQTDWGPVWGNDSQTLAFFRSGAVGGPDNESGIFRMNIAAPGSAYRISGTDEADRNPRWSLDGSWIAVESRRDPNGLDTEVFAFPSAGGAVFRLTNNTVNEQDVTWALQPETLSAYICITEQFRNLGDGQGINVRSGPSEGDTVLKPLYKDELYVIGYYVVPGSETEYWVRVQTLDSVFGWVKGSAAFASIPSGSLVCGENSLVPPVDRNGDPIAITPIPQITPSLPPMLSPTPSFTATPYPSPTPGMPPLPPVPLCVNSPTWLQALCNQGYSYLRDDQRATLDQLLANSTFSKEFIPLDAWWLQNVGRGITDVPPVVWQADSLAQCANYVRCQSIVLNSTYLFENLFRMGVDLNSSGGTGQTQNALYETFQPGLVPSNDIARGAIWGHNLTSLACNDNRFGAFVPFDGLADVCWVCQDLPTQLYLASGFDLETTMRQTPGFSLDAYANPVSRFVPTVYEYLRTQGRALQGSFMPYVVGDIAFLGYGIAPGTLSDYFHSGIVVRGYTGSFQDGLDQVLIAQMSFSSQGYFTNIEEYVDDSIFSDGQYAGRFEVITLRTYLYKNLLARGVDIPTNPSQLQTLANTYMAHGRPTGLGY